MGFLGALGRGLGAIAGGIGGGGGIKDRSQAVQRDPAMGVGGGIGGGMTQQPTQKRPFAQAIGAAFGKRGPNRKMTGSR